MSTTITWSPFKIVKEPPAAPTPEPKPIAAIPATKGGIIEALGLERHARTAEQRSAGRDAIVALDMKALQPMLTMLNEDTLSQRNAYSIVRLLIRLGRDDRQKSPYGDFAPQSADTRPLTPQADEIACTIARYALRNPDQQLNLDNLSEILPLSRLPQVIEWARSTSGGRQRDFILLFSRLTHTSFPTIPIQSSGNATNSSQKEALKRQTERQNESIAMMQEWWSNNSQRSYSSWLIDRLNIAIDHEVESLPGLLHGYEDMPRMQAVYRRRLAQWRSSLNAAAFDALCARLTDVPQYVRPYILGLIGHCDHPKRTEFIAGFLHQSD